MQYDDHAQRVRVLYMPMGKRKHTRTAGHGRQSQRGKSWRDDKRTAHARGYDADWRNSRAVHLKAHPLCVFCAARGHVTAATVVDHITPHHGDPVLFNDPANWQSLCKLCHDSQKKQIEKHGYASGSDVDGWPTDPNHPFNKKELTFLKVSRAKNKE